MWLCNYECVCNVVCQWDCVYMPWWLCVCVCACLILHVHGITSIYVCDWNCVMLCVVGMLCITIIAYGNVLCCVSGERCAYVPLLLCMSRRYCVQWDCMCNRHCIWNVVCLWDSVLLTVCTSCNAVCHCDYVCHCKCVTVVVFVRECCVSMGLRMWMSLCVCAVLWVTMIVLLWLCVTVTV